MLGTLITILWLLPVITFGVSLLAGTFLYCSLLQHRYTKNAHKRSGIPTAEV